MSRLVGNRTVCLVTENKFGVSLDAHTFELLEEISARYGVSRAGGVRLAVRAAHQTLMTAKIPFSFEEENELNRDREKSKS